MTIENFMAGLNLACLFAIMIVARKWSCYVYDEGHKDGYREGLTDGREEGETFGRIRADNWWIGVEREIEEQREKMWTEED